MKYMFQLGIIFIVSLSGDVLSSAIDVGIPGNVIGMLLMLALLVSGFLKTAQIQETSAFLLKYLAFFFIPPMVGLIDVFDLIKSYIPAIIVIGVVTTVITFYVTYLTVVAVARIGQAVKEGKS